MSAKDLKFLNTPSLRDQATNCVTPFVMMTPAQLTEICDIADSHRDALQMLVGFVSELTNLSSTEPAPGTTLALLAMRAINLLNDIEGTQ